jgi:hypothetical protein
MFHVIASGLAVAITNLRSLLNNLCKSEAPRGPSPAYTPAHIIKLLLILESEVTMGRITLARRLGIGEGSVRTIIKRLLEASIISVDAIGGCNLTEIGQSVTSDLKKIIVSTGDIDLRQMGIKVPAFAAQLRGLEIPQSPTMLRDDAVRNGADGMMILKSLDGRLCLPMMSEDMSMEYPAIDAAVKSRFELRSKDILLIGFARDPLVAEIGTISASLNLICSLLCT